MNRERELRAALVSRSLVILIVCGFSLFPGCLGARPEISEPLAICTGKQDSFPQNESGPVVPASSNVIAASEPEEVLPIDLVTVLRLTNAANPTIAVAHQSVQEALWSMRQAEWLWLPNVEGGPGVALENSWTRVTKKNVTSTKNEGEGSLTGGVFFTVNPSEAYFGPLVARSLFQAAAADQDVVTQQTQLKAALAYLDLAQAHAGLAINHDTQARAQEMLHRAESADSGNHRVAVFRARTEINLRRQERAILEAQAAAASAQLAALLHLKPAVTLRPADPLVVPVTFVPLDLTLEAMIAAALRHRPELAGSQALVQSALSSLRQSQFGPFLPQIQAGYTGGYLGTGPNDVIANFNPETTASVSLLWQLHSLGLGDLALVHGRKASLNKAQEHVVEVETQVASDVVTAAKQARIQMQVLESAQNAVKDAMQWWQIENNKLSDPVSDQSGLDWLVAGQTLAQARTQYLQIVISYNQAQLKLFTAMGQPVLDAMPKAVPLPDTMSVVPGPRETSQQQWP